MMWKVLYTNRRLRWRWWTLSRERDLPRAVRQAVRTMWRLRYMRYLAVPVPTGGRDE